MTIFGKSITITERETYSWSYWSIHRDRGRPFLLFPSIMPCIITFSKLLPLRLAKWPKWLSIWMLMVWRSRLDTPISSSILTLVLLIVHGMRSMRLQHHISKAVICLESKSRKHTKQLEMQGLGQEWLWLFWWFLCQSRSWTSLSLLNVPLLTDVNQGS